MNKVLKQNNKWGLYLFSEREETEVGEKKTKR